MRAYLCIHVSPVQIDLSTGIVDQLADVADLRLEHATRRRIRDHDRRDLLPVLFHLATNRRPKVIDSSKILHVNDSEYFRFHVFEPDIAKTVGLQRNDLETSHLRAGSIRAMRRYRDQTQLKAQKPILET